MYNKHLDEPEMNNPDPAIFNNVYSRDLLGLTENSEFDYAKVASFLEFGKDEISKLSGVSKKSVRFDRKIPKEVKERLDEIGNICLLVAEHFEGDAKKTALWFKAPNPMLGNVRPRDMLRLGRYKKLMQFIIDATSESERSEQTSQEED